jgi:hypothetical protein
MNGGTFKPDQQAIREEPNRETLEGRLVSLRRVSHSLDIVLRDFKTLTDRKAA